MNNIILLALLIAAVILSIKAGKLTTAGGICGGLVALCIYVGTGIWGVAMLAAFFLAGTLATKWGLREKEALGYAEHDKGKRKASQVFANGGLAAIFGLAACVFPAHSGSMLLAVAACFSSATADTLSSELGTLYGRRFYNVLSFRQDKRGENGVVSLEGSLVGIGGSLLISGIYLVASGSARGAVIVLLSGTIGNLIDSILGATLERKGAIGNDAVNFLNTFSAALVALSLSYLLQ
jgi:uncharacterized protein (TIGR00297 family)